MNNNNNKFKNSREFQRYAPVRYGKYRGHVLDIDVPSQIATVVFPGGRLKAIPVRSLTNNVHRNIGRSTRRQKIMQAVRGPPRLKTPVRALLQTPQKGPSLTVLQRQANTLHRNLKLLQKYTNAKQSPMVATRPLSLQPPPVKKNTLLHNIRATRKNYDTLLDENTKYHNVVKPGLLDNFMKEKMELHLLRRAIETGMPYYPTRTFKQLS